jgi:HEAT repeat protein
MLKRLLEQRLRLPAEKVSRLLHFAALSFTLGVAVVLGISLAESVFLANAHQDRLPMFYVLLAAVSIPIATGFSGLVDRFRRPAVFRYLLLACVALVLALRLLLRLEALPVYFAVYIGLSLVELLLDILFWVLVGDYFSSLELKRYATVFVAAMALGGLTGGGAAFLLADVRHVPAGQLLLALPLVFVAALVQVTLLDRKHREFGAGGDEEEEGSLVESLKAFPPLLRRYPLVLLLVANVLLVAVLQRVADYQVFSIYENTYKTEEALTGFLGLLNASLNVLEALLTFFLTRPLLARIGVGGMNVVFPATTLASFAGLAVPELGAGAARLRLTSAIAGHVNYETLYNSVAQPVETLNYNAIPRRFVGRVRVLNDGLVYPAGAAIAGGLLLLAEKLDCTPLQISLAGATLSSGFLVLGYLLSKGYLKSLLEMLRSRSVNLDDVREGLAQLPAGYADEVRPLLTSEDPASQRLGVELAARMDPALFLDDLETLLPKADAGLRRALVKLYASVRSPEASQRVRALLHSSDDAARGVSLEALIASGQPLEETDLRALLADSNPVLRSLAAAGARLSRAMTPEIDAAVAASLRGLNPEALAAVTRVIHTAVQNASPGGQETARLLALVKEVWPSADAAFKAEALGALEKVAEQGDEGIEALAASELGHANAGVRAAAYRILGALRTEQGMALAAQGLEDSSKLARENAAAALAAYGERSLPLATEKLSASRAEVADAAILALGRIRTRRAEDALFEFMQNDYRQVRQNQAWLEHIGSANGIWAPLRTAIEDSNQRAVRRVLHLLAAMGHERALDCAQRILTTPDERARADAVETLASLSHRRFIEPVLPLLEAQAAGPAGVPEGPAGTSDAQRVLREALESGDRWIRIGAMAVLCAEQSPVPPETLRDNPDPLIRAAVFHTLLAKSQAVLAQNAPALESSPKEFFMNRVIFLKKVPLFQYLSLDDLLIIDEALAQKEFLAGETVFAEGSLGAELCIVFRGSVVIRKKRGGTECELARLGPGECFGEMALFDAAPRSATALGVTDCTLLTLERNRFHTLLTQRPEMALEVCRVLSLRLRAANERLESAAQATH